ncbi:MAG: gephyrin-like molybdotransferase Glp [Dehalococcoidia bacterium]
MADTHQHNQAAHTDHAEHRHVHPHRADMLSVEQALERVLALVNELPVAEVPLLDADGLTLARDVHAPFDIPALANSAMDGYAVRTSDVAGASEDLPVTLPVIGQVQAGQLAETPLAEGTAIRILTGAPLPAHADAIVPYEFTDEVERREREKGLAEITIKHAPVLGDHVRPAGEDAAKGALVLPKGRVLDPPSIGLLASFGFAAAPVVRRPRIAILSTGDEVELPGSTLPPGHLYDSNSFGTAAAVRRWGAEPVMLGIARDNMDDLRAKLRQGLDADMLITSAGVSAGAFDMVKDALAELGGIDFWAVRMRPARPIAFGSLLAPDGRRVPHLGLPGNPVSALVALVEFGRPAIAKMRGATPAPLPTVRAVLDDAIVNPDGRRVYARVTLERRSDGLHARLTGSQGSNLLSSMALAHGLAVCPEDVPQRAAGEIAVVQLLDWLDSSALLTEQLDLTR